jgi:uroporphyrinogen decarboxylase
MRGMPFNGTAREGKQMTGKELALEALSGKKTPRIPAGFWFHFVDSDCYATAPGNNRLFTRTLEGHKKYFEKVGFEILKIMSEGYFVFPGHRKVSVNDSRSLATVEPSERDGPWFDEQVSLALELSRFAGKDAAVYYTIFSPFAYLSFSGLYRGEHVYGDAFAAAWMSSAPDALRDALEIVAHDVVALTERILEEGGADGIFFAVRAYEGITNEEYSRFIEPGERAVTEAVAKTGKRVILHICGETKGDNDLARYASYDAGAYNWAIDKEGLSLSQGRQFFARKGIVGGFDHTTRGEIYRGDYGAIQKKTEAILSEVDEGLLIGADCALPPDIDYRSLIWLRELLRSR